MISIDLKIDAGDWASDSFLTELTSRALLSATTHLDRPLHSETEVSLVFTDNDHVQALNRQWRNQDKPTNVLSFAANEGGGPQTPLLGDIIFAYEIIAWESKEQNKNFDDHLTHLIIHGFLHLLGYDHIEDAQAEEMEALEILMLASLGIADPYRCE